MCIHHTTIWGEHSQSPNLDTLPLVFSVLFLTQNSHLSERYYSFFPSIPSSSTQHCTQAAESLTKCWFCSAQSCFIFLLLKSEKKRQHLKYWNESNIQGETLILWSKVTFREIKALDSTKGNQWEKGYSSWELGFSALKAKNKESPSPPSKNIKSAVSKYKSC